MKSGHNINRNSELNRHSNFNQANNDISSSPFGPKKMSQELDAIVNGRASQLDDSRVGSPFESANRDGPGDFQSHERNPIREEGIKVSISSINSNRQS